MSEKLKDLLAQVAQEAAPIVASLIQLAASLLAAWLVAKVNVLQIAGLGQDDLQTYIAAGLTGLVTAVVSTVARVLHIQTKEARAVRQHELLLAVAHARAAAPAGPLCDCGKHLKAVPGGEAS